MLRKLFVLFTISFVTTLVSCRGKAGVKVLEKAQKALKKAPKENKEVNATIMLPSSKYADDAVRVIKDIDREEEYIDDSENDW